MTTQPVSSTIYIEVPDDCPANVALRPDDTIDAFFGDDQHAVILTFTPAGLQAFVGKMINAARLHGQERRSASVARNPGPSEDD